MRKLWYKYRINIKENDCLLLVCLSIVIFILYIRKINFLDQIIVLNDEFGYWSIAASISGKEWGELISNTPYYSYGYSFLLVPLFFLKLPVYIVYKIAILFNVLMILGSFYISIYCGKSLFPQISPKIIFLCSFLVSCYSNNIVQAQVAWTETFLYFLFWLATLILIFVIRKPTVVRISGYIFVLMYMFVTHQRTLGIVLAGFFVLFLYLFSHRDIKKIFFSIFLILLLVGIQFGIKINIKDWLWNTSKLGTMNDFSGQISLLDSLFTQVGIRGLFFGFLGRIFYFFISGGLIWTSGVFFICNTIIKKVRNKFCFKDDVIIYIFIVFSFLLSIAIGLTSVINGFSRCDSVVYGRYIENTIGPILLFGSICLFQKVNVNKVFLIQIIGTIITGYTTIYILKLISNSQFNDICSVGLAMFFSDGDKITAIYKAIIFAILQAIIIYLFIKSNLARIKFVLIFLVFLAGWRESINYVFDHTIAYMQNIKTDYNEKLAQTLKDINTKKIYYVKDINWDPYCTNIKYLQFLVPDIIVEVIEPEDVKMLDKNSVWVCEKGSNQSNNLIKEVCILNESSELYICTSFDSEVCEKYKRGIVLTDNIGKIRDEKFPEEYRTSGKEGLLFDNISLNMSEGTYCFKIEGELLSNQNEVEKIGKCFVTSQNGSDLIAEEPITIQDDKNVDIELFFSCMDTKDISLNAEIMEGYVLRIDSISYYKVRNEYVVAADREVDFDEIMKRISSFPQKKITYISNHRGMKLNNSYVDEAYPELSIEYYVKDNFDMGNDKGDFILLEKNGTDMFEYLSKYECVFINKSYILMVNKDSNIYLSMLEQGYSFYSKNGMLNLETLKIMDDGTVLSDNKIFLEQGQYVFYVESEYETGYITFNSGNADYKKFSFEGIQTPIIQEVSIPHGGKEIEWIVNRVITEEEEDINIFVEKKDSASYLLNSNIEFDSQNTMCDEKIPLGLELSMGTYKFDFRIENTDDISQLSGAIELYRDTDIHEVLITEECFSNLEKDEEGIFNVGIEVKVDKTGMKNIKYRIKMEEGSGLIISQIKYQKIE